MSEETKEERRKRDLMVLEREAKFFAENRHLVGDYMDRIIEVCTMIPMCEENYQESFEQFNGIFDFLYEIMDIMQDSGIGILLPEHLRRYN